MTSPLRNYTLLGEPPNGATRSTRTRSVTKSEMATPRMAGTVAIWDVNADPPVFREGLPVSRILQAIEDSTPPA